MAGEKETVKKRPEKKKKKDDSVTQPQNNKSEGESSGLYSKIIFFVLISILGLAIGVIFFKLGPLKEQEKVETIVDIPESQPEVHFDALEEHEATYTKPVISDSKNVIDEPSTVPEIESNRVEEADEAVLDNILLGEQDKANSLVEEAGKVIVDSPIQEEKHSKPETSEAAEKESSNNFESQLEDDTPEVPEESFIIRAERETIQEAVDRVWALTVQCIEELRALHSLAKSQLTYDVIGVITKRLEPLRTQLDSLVHNTYNNIFDGALEQAAQLESSLRVVLDDLEDAKKKDILLAKDEGDVADLEAEVESKPPVDPLPVEIEEPPKGDAQKTSSTIEVENEIDEPAVDDNN